MDHDRLFKELLTTYFADFIALFLPAVDSYLDRQSIEFLDKEIFTDVSASERHEVDLLAKARFKGEEAFFLIHVENQSSTEPTFAARMFRYFARLQEKFSLPVYPIALFSFDAPQRPEPDQYGVSFPDLDVLTFRFRAIQLNQLNWHEFIRRPNPVAAALMTKMKIDPADRPRVKLECLRMIVTLKLDPARQQLIKTFMDSYLRLSALELQVYNREIEASEAIEREAVMEVLNEWEEIGQLRGIRMGEAAVILRQLGKKLGEIPIDVRQRIESLPQDRLEELADAVLDFSSLDDAKNWLATVA